MPAIRLYLCTMVHEFALEEIDRIAAGFAPHLKQHRVLAFHGEMGAGKTTFIAAVCKVLGVKTAVASPTFALIYEYSAPTGPIFHMDLYRIKSEEEAIRAGVEDALWSSSPCFVEWPDRAPALLPPDTLHVHLETLEGNRRRLRISNN